MQGVSLGTDKRELQRLARDSAEYCFRDKQVEASDALIDDVGALLTESGGAQIIATSRFAAKAGDFGLRLGFAVDLCENKPYGPHEGECWESQQEQRCERTFCNDRIRATSDRDGITHLYSIFSISEQELVLRM